MNGGAKILNTQVAVERARHANSGGRQDGELSSLHALDKQTISGYVHVEDAFFEPATAPSHSRMGAGLRDEPSRAAERTRQRFLKPHDLEL